MLLWGRVADVHGRWGVFLAGATLFSLFTLLVPFAPSELFLYTLSGLQGFSSAATVPSGIGILASTFPPGRERNRAFVAMIASSSVGSVLGNIAGGAIGGLLSWKWGFWIPASMAGVVALAAFGLWPSKPKSFSRQMADHDSSSHARSELTEGSVDYIGGALITASLALLQIGLSQGNAIGWANLHVPGLICASILLGSLFVNMQLGMERKPNRYPLVRLSTFKNPSFSAAFVVVACFFGSFNSFLVYASML
jgi:MFS family permease